VCLSVVSLPRLVAVAMPGDTTNTSPVVSKEAVADTAASGSSATNGRGKQRKVRVVEGVVTKPRPTSAPSGEVGRPAAVAQKAESLVELAQPAGGQSASSVRGREGERKKGLKMGKEGDAPGVVSANKVDEGGGAKEALARKAKEIQPVVTSSKDKALPKPGTKVVKTDAGLGDKPALATAKATVAAKGAGRMAPAAKGGSGKKEISPITTTLVDREPSGKDGKKGRAEKAVSTVTSGAAHNSGSARGDVAVLATVERSKRESVSKAAAATTRAVPKGPPVGASSKPNEWGLRQAVMGILPTGGTDQRQGVQGSMNAWLDATKGKLPSPAKDTKNGALSPVPDALGRLAWAEWPRGASELNDAAFSDALERAAMDGIVGERGVAERNQVFAEVAEVVRGACRKSSMEMDVAVEPFGSMVQGTATDMSDLDLTLVGIMAVEQRATVKVVGVGTKGKAGDGSDSQADGGGAGAHEQEDRVGGSVGHASGAGGTKAGTQVVVKELHALSKEQKGKLLSKIAKAFRAEPKFKVGAVISKARVPLLKLQHKPSGIACDLSVGNRAAIKSQILREVCQVDPRVRPLMMAIKKWAQGLSLNFAATGTFNTFSLNLLAVFHLQNRPLPILPPLSELLSDNGAVSGAAALKATRPLDSDLSDAGASSLVDRVAWRAEAFRRSGAGYRNRETVGGLFISFVVEMLAILGMSSRHPGYAGGSAKRPPAADVWTARWVEEIPGGAKWRWLGVLDPFERLENASRAITGPSLDQIVKGLRHTANRIACAAARGEGELAAVAPALLDGSMVSYSEVAARLPGEGRSAPPALPVPHGGTNASVSIASVRKGRRVPGSPGAGDSGTSGAGGLGGVAGVVDARVAGVGAHQPWGAPAASVVPSGFVGGQGGVAVPMSVSEAPELTDIGTEGILAALNRGLVEGPGFVMYPNGQTLKVGRVQGHVVEWERVEAAIEVAKQAVEANRQQRTGSTGYISAAAAVFVPQNARLHAAEGHMAGMRHHGEEGGAAGHASASPAVPGSINDMLQQLASGADNDMLSEAPLHMEELDAIQKQLSSLWDPSPAPRAHGLVETLHLQGAVPMALAYPHGAHGHAHAHHAHAHHVHAYEPRHEQVHAGNGHGHGPVDAESVAAAVNALDIASLVATAKVPQESTDESDVQQSPEFVASAHQLAVTGSSPENTGSQRRGIRLLRRGEEPPAPRPKPTPSKAAQSRAGDGRAEAHGEASKPVSSSQMAAVGSNRTVRQGPGVFGMPDTVGTPQIEGVDDDMGIGATLSREDEVFAAATATGADMDNTWADEVESAEIARERSESTAGTGRVPPFLPPPPPPPRDGRPQSQGPGRGLGGRWEELRGFGQPPPPPPPQVSGHYPGPAYGAKQYGSYGTQWEDGRINVDFGQRGPQGHAPGPQRWGNDPRRGGHGYEEAFPTLGVKRDGIEGDHAHEEPVRAKREGVVETAAAAHEVAEEQSADKRSEAKPGQWGSYAVASKLSGGARGATVGSTMVSLGSLGAKGKGT